MSGPNRSSITAGNGVTGNAEFILNANSNMDTSWFQSNYLSSPIVVEADLLPNGAIGNTDIDLNIKVDLDSKNLQVNNNINIQLPK